MTTIFGAPAVGTDRVRARDIQMSAVALLETRTILVSGSLETSDRAVMVTYELPSTGQWTFIKTETNLSNQDWRTWIMSVEEGGAFVENPDNPTTSLQFAKYAISADGLRLGFYDGEVRPGESVLKRFTVISPNKRFYMSHGRRHQPHALPEEIELLNEVEQGYSLDPAYEIVVPVKIRF